MLGKAASLEAWLEDSGITKTARVRVTNQSGHKLPTGYAEGRRMWINLKAFDAAQTLIYESGAYDPATGELSLDSAIKLYEVKQGITPELAAILDLPAGFGRSQAAVAARYLPAGQHDRPVRQFADLNRTVAAQQPLAVGAAGTLFEDF